MVTKKNDGLENGSWAEKKSCVIWCCCEITSWNAAMIISRRVCGGAGVWGGNAVLVLCWWFVCVQRERKEGDSCGKQGSYQKPQAALDSVSFLFLSSSSSSLSVSLSPSSLIFFLFFFLFLSHSIPPSLCSLAMLMIDGLRVLMGAGEQELRSGLSWQLGEGAFCCCFTCKLSSNTHTHPYTHWPHVPPCQHHLFHSLFLLCLRSLFLCSFSFHPTFLCLFSLLLLMLSETTQLLNCVYSYVCLIWVNIQNLVRCFSISCNGGLLLDS